MTGHRHNEVSRILSRIDAEDGKPAEELMPLVYEELRRLARARMRREAPGHTLSATALVHEAWIRLADGLEPPEEGARGPGWNGRAHFFGAAAEAMRRILIERARGKDRQKRGGGRLRVDIEAIDGLGRADPFTDVLAVDEALTELAKEEPTSPR